MRRKPEWRFPRVFGSRPRIVATEVRVRFICAACRFRCLISNGLRPHVEATIEATMAAAKTSTAVSTVCASRNLCLERGATIFPTITEGKLQMAPFGALLPPRCPLYQQQKFAISTKKTDPANVLAGTT